MTKKNIQHELDAIIKALRAFSTGAHFEEIMNAFHPRLEPRTLQRRLSALIKDGLIQASGKTKARRYYLNASLMKSKEKPSKGSVLVLSHEAREIQTNVCLPIQARKPIGYQREFLEKYQPNVTFYLSENFRQKLLELGKTIHGAYPAGTYARHIFHRLLIDLSWNSSRLEGNTYSLLETERLLEFGAMAEGKDAKETQMILNHKAAIEFLVDFSNGLEVNRYIILSLHALLSDNLLSDVACGRLRQIPVGIGESVYIPPSIPQVINECFERLITTANAIQDPFEQAFFLMIQLPYLQPFEDVNKRTSRLAANIPLIKRNLCPLSFIDVPEDTYIHALLGIYELNQTELLRDLFMWAYERSCFLYSETRNTLGEPDVFRMQYRDTIIQLIGEIVRKNMNKLQAITTIRYWTSKSVPEQDQIRFIEIVERELQSLHEGSIARYKLRPSEYATWKAGWL